MLFTKKICIEIINAFHVQGGLENQKTNVVGVPLKNLSFIFGT